jgi:hypothetical protein
MLIRHSDGRISDDEGHAIHPITVPVGGRDSLQEIAWRYIQAWELSKHRAVEVQDHFAEARSGLPATAPASEVPAAPTPPELPLADMEPDHPEVPLHPVDALELVFRDLDLDVDPARMQRLRAYLDAPHRCYTVPPSSWREIEPEGL